MPASPSNRFLRLLALLVAVALAVVWFWPELQRQQRYMHTAKIVLITTLVLLVWQLFFSRKTWSKRLAGCALLLAPFVLFGAAFRIRGVDGDLLPILEPRWTSKKFSTLEPAPTPNAAALPASAATNAPQAGFPADSFPQYYGPNRNGVIDDPALRLATNWSSAPPRVLWRQPVGPAWSGFAVRGAIAVTQEQHAEKELVTGYDLRTGRLLWRHADEARYATTIAGEGPRATPALSVSRVFTFGGTGLLNCLDLASGQKIWQRDTARDHSAKLPDWGFSGSPLVVDDQVIVSVGGEKGHALSAYSATDGRPLWSQGPGGLDYSSPLAATLLGVRQILIFHGGGVGAHALDGQPLWQYPWPGSHPHVSLPVPVGSDRLLISSGYGTGSELVKIERSPSGAWSAARLWKSLALKSKFGPIFVIGAHIYGLDDGMLACVDLETGQRRWKDGRYGHGQALLVNGLLLLTSEKGSVVLIQPSPAGRVELASFPVFEAKTWNPPALSGRLLLVRNDLEAACLELPVLPPL